MAAFPEQLLAPHKVVQATFTNARIALIDLRQLYHQSNGSDGCSSLDSLLYAEENRIYSGFTYPKRRMEWLGGRLAAKYALAQLLAGQPSLSYEALSIVPDVHGRPVVNWSLASFGMVSVSISHSVDYAAAMASRQAECGIDIQCNSERLLRVQDRFASDAELELLEAEENLLARLSMLWSTKEAVKKCYLATDLTFFGKIQLAGARKYNENFWRLDCRLDAPVGLEATVHVLLFEQYCLAYVEK